MAYHHFFESIVISEAPGTLKGAYGRVINPATNLAVPIYADPSGTPIISVSGQADMARSDADGNLSFYVEPGTYDLVIYDTDATTFIKRVSNYAMNSTKGDKGDEGDPGPQGPRGPADSNAKSALNAFQPFVAYLSRYNQASGGPTLFYDFGSSVGNGAALGSAAATNNPGAYFFAKAQEFFDPLGIFQFTRTNGSVDGSTLIDMRTLWNSTIAPANPKVSFGVPGMNDFQIPGFNTGQTFDPTFGSPAALRDILRKAQQSGCTVVLSTSPHPHVGRIDYNFFTANPTIAQAYPTVVAAPVPASSVVPTPGASVRSINWNGVSISVDARFLRGNNMIRAAASEFGCALIDAERKQFDLLAQGYTYDQMYTSPEVVHPNLWAIQNTYHAAINDLFNGMRNDGVINASPSAIGPRLGVNADETVPYAARIAPSNGDDVLLLEDQSGADLFTVAANGAIEQVAGATAKFGPSIVRRTSVDPALGVPKDGFAGAASTNAAQSFTIPPGSAARLFLHVAQSGSGSRVGMYNIVSTLSAATLSAEIGGVGDPATFYSIDASGLTITVTPTSANTNIKLYYEVW